MHNGETWRKRRKRRQWCEGVSSGQLLILPRNSETHPQLVSSRLSPTCRDAMPKSAIRILFFSSSSRFSGFRSLWLRQTGQVQLWLPPEKPIFTYSPPLRVRYFQDFLKTRCLVAQDSPHSDYIVQDSLEILPGLLPLSPLFWNYKYVPSSLTLCVCVCVIGSCHNVLICGLSRPPIWINPSASLSQILGS